MKIFTEIKKYKKDVIEIALGNFGTSLLNFSKNLNNKHFGISDIPIDEDLSNKLIDILRLVNYALNNNLSTAVCGINKFYKKNIPSDLENIDKKFIRLIKNNKKREQARSTKKICDISLLKFYEKAKIIWEKLPDDFQVYTRNNTGYIALLRDAEVKANRYKELGCYELYDNIKKSIEETKKNMEDMYEGYHRISLRNASVILSKINRFELRKEDYNIIKNTYLICSGKHIYNPRIYPIRYLKEILTPKMSCLLKDMEKVPLFDYYMVLVPSTKNTSYEKDIFDIKNKNSIPIIMGEKDGKCYFISYWT